MVTPTDRKRATSGRPTGDGLAARLWKAAEVVAYESLHCPFVTALGQGTLNRATFQHYVAQDAFFLQYFVRAYALAMSKCDPAHISQATFDKLSTLLRGVHEELRLHGAYAASWGVDLETHAAPSPATLAYTDFLMEVANDTNTGLAEVLCAMAPCARLYAFLGCTLAAAHPGATHAYAEWIASYSSDAYLAIPKLKEEMLEEAAAAYGTDEGRLLRLYTRAMQLEVDFFCAQPAAPTARSIRSLVVDFDDTCTEADTISLLFEAAADSAGRAQGPAASQAVRDTATHLSANYLQQYDTLMHQLFRDNNNNSSCGGAAAASVGQVPSARSSAGGQQAVELQARANAYDPQGLSLFLDQLSDFDSRMLKPVEDSGILAGLTARDIAAAAARVRLRPGCRTVLERALASGLPVHVLSIHWSSQLIMQALNLQQRLTSGLPSGLRPGQHPSTQQLLCAAASTPLDLPLDLSKAAPAGVNLVVANQLECVGDVATGRIATAITCARDKAWAYAALAGGAHGDGGEGASVYVGDSITDLPALLQADYGVVVGSSGSLRRLCKRYGITLQPLVTAPLAGSATKGVLYEASSWGEIEAFLFGPRNYEAHPYKAQMQAVRASWTNQATVKDGPAPPAVAGSGPAGAAGGAPPVSGLGGQVQAGQQVEEVAGTRSRPKVPVVLTIAGSDSGGGAGIQADLKAMQACGVFGTSALAALTAQNTQGVQSVHVPPLEVLAAQLDSVLSDLGPHAVKTGMLPTPEAVKLVAAKVREYGVRRLVVDPVMVSTSGHSLVGSEAAQALADHLLPLALIITPNIPEAEVLLGGREIHNEADMCQAAKDLHAQLGCQAVLLKGGHLVGSGARPARNPTPTPTTTGGGGGATSSAPAGATVHMHAPPLQAWGTGGTGLGSVVVDVLYDGHELHVMRSPTIKCSNTHGTGCTLGSAIASFLARGLPVLPAVMQGREYLQGCLRHSTELHIGTGVQRPFNHGWQLADWQQGHLASQGPAQGGIQGSAVCRWAHQDVRRAMTLYGVMDPVLNAKHKRSAGEAAALAVAGGVTILQIREKEVEGGLFLQRAAEVLKVCRAAGVPLIINDRIDIALALGPDVGVHIGQGDLPVHVARSLLGPARMLGVSVKTEEQARSAIAAGADYLGVGAVYPTTTKDSRVIGLDGLAAVAAAAHPVPIVAIGGIKDHHIEGVMTTGAAGVAVVTAIFDQGDVTGASHKLYERITAASRAAAA